MTEVMVLAAGLGMRLSEITSECPKPLVALGDAPLLDQILRRVSAQGFASAVINTHHHASDFEAYRRSLPREFTLHVSHETRLLGTAGGVQRASALLDVPRVIWNGDIYVDPPLRALRDVARAEAVCFLVAPTSGRGTLGLDDQGHVVRLRGERFGEEQRAADYLGVMSLGSSLRVPLPEEGCLIADVCLPHLRLGGRISTQQHAGRWFDVGSLAGYRDASAFWLAEQGLESFVARDAELEPEVRVIQSSIGSGAQVVGRGDLERCIVWPRARATVPLRDAVVLPSGRVIPLPS